MLLTELLQSLFFLAFITQNLQILASFYGSSKKLSSGKYVEPIVNGESLKSEYIDALWEQMQTWVNANRQSIVTKKPREIFELFWNRFMTERHISLPNIRLLCEM